MGDAPLCVAARAINAQAAARFASRAGSRRARPIWPIRNAPREFNLALGEKSSRARDNSPTRRPVLKIGRRAETLARGTASCANWPHNTCRRRRQAGRPSGRRRAKSATNVNLINPAAPAQLAPTIGPLAATANFSRVLRVGARNHFRRGGVPVVAERIDKRPARVAMVARGGNETSSRSLKPSFGSQIKLRLSVKSFARTRPTTQKFAWRLFAASDCVRLRVVVVGPSPAPTL